MKKGRGKHATPDDETCHARFPYPPSASIARIARGLRVAVGVTPAAVEQPGRAINRELEAGFGQVAGRGHIPKFREYRDFSHHWNLLDFFGKSWVNFILVLFKIAANFIIEFILVY